jgi:hypothetical protein
MLVVLLLLTSTFATEIAESIGKQSVRWRRENVYELAFLSLFWGLLFLFGTLAFGAEFHLSLASLPFLGIRLVLEVILAFAIAEAVVRTDRTTMAFLRLLTIPLLLVVDIALGYHITTPQYLGIALMFCALMLAFKHNAHGRRGAWIAALTAILSVATISLYKYDITHFNSVVGEQSVVISGMLIVFALASFRQRHRSPMRLLFRPATGTQALSNGIVIPLESFAMTFVPASLAISLKRSFSVMWAIIFGGTYFHEHSLRRKTSSGVLMTISLVLIASPLLPISW